MEQRCQNGRVRQTSFRVSARAQTPVKQLWKYHISARSQNHALVVPAAMGRQMLRSRNVVHATHSTTLAMRAAVSVLQWRFAKSLLFAAHRPPLSLGATSAQHRMEGMEAQDGVTNVPDARRGSGTTWLPDSSRLHAHFRAVGAWRRMLQMSVLTRFRQCTSTAPPC